MYDAFELELVAEYDCYDGTTACEPYFQEADYPEGFDENPNDPEFLEACNVLRFFWTIYGHKLEGGVEALIDSDNYEHLKKQFDFFVKLLEARTVSLRFLECPPVTDSQSRLENRAAFRKLLEDENG